MVTILFLFCVVTRASSTASVLATAYDIVPTAIPTASVSDDSAVGESACGSHITHFVSFTWFLKYVQWHICHVFARRQVPFHDMYQYFK